MSNGKWGIGKVEQPIGDIIQIKIKTAGAERHQQFVDRQSTLVRLRRIRPSKKGSINVEWRVANVECGMTDRCEIHQR